MEVGEEAVVAGARGVDGKRTRGAVGQLSLEVGGQAEVKGGGQGKGGG